MRFAFKNGKKPFIALALTILTIALIPTIMPQIGKINAQADTFLEVLPMENNFYINDTAPGSTFTINVTIVNVTDLQNWQIGIGFDPTILNFSSFVVPPDNVFAGAARALIVPPPIIDNGSVTVGATYINDPYWTFNGTGTVCQFTLQILEPTVPLPITTNLTLLTTGDFPSFLISGAGPDIPFDPVDGSFNYSYRIAGELELTLSPITRAIKVFNSVQFSVNVTEGVPPFHYNWDINGIVQPDALDDSSPTFQFNATATTYHVRVNVTDNDGATGTATSTITTAPMAVTISPASITLDVGATQTFMVNVADGVSPFSYSWFLNGTFIPDATDLTQYDITFSDTGVFNVKINVTGSDGKSILTAPGSTIIVLPAGTAGVSVVPVDGSTFNSNEVTIGDRITYNITAQDVQFLGNWQANVTWDETLLALTDPATDVIVPSDNVFSEAEAAGYTIVNPGAPDVGTNSMMYGAAILQTDTPWTFNGTGVLMQIVLTIVRQPDDPASTCTIGLANKYTDTFMLDAMGTDISFSITESSYTYNLIKTVTHSVAGTTVTTYSNASILSNNVTVQNDGSLEFMVNGKSGTGYYVNVTIPKTIFTEVGIVKVNGIEVTNPEITSDENNNYVYISMPFSSSSTINILPENILLLLLAGLMVSVVSVAFIKNSSKRKWMK
jgi:hypothetical protein